MDSRLLVGASSEPGGRDVRAVLIEVSGWAAGSRATVLDSAGAPSDLTPADAFTHAVRALLHRSPPDREPVLAIGWRCPQPIGNAPNASAIGAELAERTGITAIGEFDRFGPAQRPAADAIELLAEWLLNRDAALSRLLLHLDDGLSLTYVRPQRPPSERVVRRATGPGVRFLDRLIAVLTQGRQVEDPRGLLAVQGRQIRMLADRWNGDPALANWAAGYAPDDHSTLLDNAVAWAVDCAVEQGWSAADMLCTATHCMAGWQVETARLLTAGSGTPGVQVILTGRGALNGLLRRALDSRLVPSGLPRTETSALTACYRPAAVAMLASLALDGVDARPAGESTGVTRRLVGQFAPGLLANWRRCIEWMNAAPAYPDRLAA